MRNSSCHDSVLCDCEKRVFFRDKGDKVKTMIPQRIMQLFKKLKMLSYSTQGYLYDGLNFSNVKYVFVGENRESTDLERAFSLPGTYKSFIFSKNVVIGFQ